MKVSMTEISIHTIALKFIKGKIVSEQEQRALHQATLLVLRNNQITDISPLASLTNLKELDLGGNRITYISPLASLTNLKYLYLDNNQITDLSPLASLTNLKKLGLYNNQSTDISLLASLTNLEELYLATYMGIATRIP